MPGYETVEQKLFVNLTDPSIPHDHWVSCPRPNPKAQLRLFFFPYAGAGSTTYHAWSRLFPMEVETYLVHLPGRDKRIKEPPFIEFVLLIESLTQALLPFLGTPFSFFGHSMGGLLSFEVARQLRRQYSLLPVHLFVSGRRAPHLLDARPNLHQLPDKEFLTEIESRYGTLPELVLNDREFLQLFLSILRADLTLIETYQYSEETPLECPISAFGGLQDDTATRAELLAWREQTKDRFDLKLLPGDHFFIQSSKGTVAQAMNEDLGRFIHNKV